LLVAGIYLTGCGGSSQPASVAVTASGTTVDATDAVTLTAAVTNDKNAAGVTWSVSGGGTLSNTTTSTATYTAPAASSTALTVTVTATSVADATKTGTATITVPAKPAITTGALAAGTVGTAYSATMAASGGIGPYTWSITSGTLPAGLTMNSAGAISGTPTAAAVGTTNLTFVLTDSGKATALTATVALGLQINAAPPIAFLGVVPGTSTYNVAYTGSAAASGGAGALTYSLTLGALPTGLTLNAATGAIIGTPTVTGTFNFTIKAADTFGDSLSQSYSIAVSYPAVVVTPATLPTGYAGSVYHQSTLAATGGSGTGFSFALANGTLLPAGLSLSSGGVITGTPTTTGTTNFSVTATDSASNTGNGNFSITVNAGVSITTGLTLPTGYVGGNYSQTLAATGGSGTGYTWAVSSGSTLPAGLSLSTAGVLSGKPTTAGTPSFSITATDSAGNTASATFSVTIAAGVSIIAPTIPAGYPGSGYPATTFTASGGTNTGFAWSWAAASGSTLPAGLSIGSTTGTITGTPTNSTSSSVVSNLVVTVTDSIGNQATTPISVTIEASVAITTTTLASGTVNAAYSQQLAASGGSGTGFTWTTTGANNLAPFGLSLSSTGLLSSTNLGSSTGTVNFTAQVTDSLGHSISAPMSFTVYAALTVTTTTLPATNVGASYSQTLAAGGGTGAGYSWTATSSNLATYGLSLSTAGVITGAPTQAGTASFTANVKDSGNNTALQALTITVYSALSLPAPDPSSLPSTGYTNVAYTGAINASGGSGSYSWQVTGLSDNLTPSPAGGVLTISGTPGATPGTVTFNVTLTDTTTNASVTQNGYNIAISTPTPVTLPTPSSTIPGAATENQAYNGAITVSGGVSPYTWSINGTTVTGAGLALTNGLTATSSGGSSLTITGTPTTLTAVPLTNVKVTDSVGSNQTNSYSIVVNSAGSQVSGQISMNNICGATAPTFTVTINTSPAQSVQTGSNGSFTFAGIPNGTYTITPSIPGASSSLFYPASYTGIPLNNSTNNNVTGENFNAVVGYTVSGTVSYTTGGTAQTGQTYLVLNNNSCGSYGAPGTSITNATLTSGGAFTIRGVPPGSYTLDAWMDPLGQGSQNAIDPTGAASVTVTSANVTNAAVTMTNPTFATPSSNAAIGGIIPNASGVLIEFTPSTNSNKEEDATQYTVEWSTSSTLGGGTGGAQFASVAGSHTFPAIGTKSNIWILNNTVTGANSFTSGQTYYFQVRSFNPLDTANPHPSGWCNYTSSGCSGVTGFTGVVIGTPACNGTCTTVSGAVTIPSGITLNAGAPLYIGIYQNSSSGNGPSAIYATEVASPVVGGSGNSYSLTIPSGSGYVLFGIVDQNNDGEIDANDVTNTGDNNSSGVTVSGSTMSQSLTLPATNSTATVTTQYQSGICSGCSSPSTSYQIDVQVREANKLPVAVTLASGPNLMEPIDISACSTCGSQQFDYSATLPGGTPNVGDTYNFTVTYSDGSQDTGSTVNGAVTAFGSTGAVVGPSDLATNLSPSATSSTSTTPTFTWTFPANPSNYVYSFYISPGNCSGSCNNIWQIPSNNSNSSGFTYAETSGGSGTTGTLTWGTDPIPGDSSSPTGPLSAGTPYNWSIQVQDTNGNQAQSSTWYQP
jgi:hypothetical protein